MATPKVIRLGARQKSNKYALGNIYANMVFLEESEPNYIYCPKRAPLLCELFIEHYDNDSLY